MLLLFFRQMFLVRARRSVCVLFIGIVQRNRACLTWKSALEIKSLLLLLLLLVTLIFAGSYKVVGKQNRLSSFCCALFN